jgi:diguanylate cyclase (GGDEF)-like protein
MAGGFKLLLVEDQHVDGALARSEWELHGIGFSCQRVASEETLRCALQEFCPDVILCEQSVPKSSRRALLDVVRLVRPTTPVLLVSKTIAGPGPVWQVVIGIPARMQRPAHPEALIGLANPANIDDLVCRAIDHASHRNQMMALITIAIDAFRAVEVRLGRGLADELLERVSDAITMTLKARGAAVRVGTDEFLVVLPELRDPADAAARVQQILDAIAAPHNLGGKDVQITASAGIAIYPIDGNDCEALRCKVSAAIQAVGPPGRMLFCSPAVPRLTRRKLYLREVESPAIIALFSILAMSGLLTVVWWLL